ncbi:unnamed protein product [Merluccius merluccius]
MPVAWGSMLTVNAVSSFGPPFAGLTLQADPQDWSTISVSIDQSTQQIGEWAENLLNSDNGGGGGGNIQDLLMGYG